MQPERRKTSKPEPIRAHLFCDNRTVYFEVSENETINTGRQIGICERINLPSEKNNML